MTNPLSTYHTQSLPSHVLERVCVFGHPGLSLDLEGGRLTSCRCLRSSDLRDCGTETVCMREGVGEMGEWVWVRGVNGGG